MASYICKCGRVVNKTTLASNTGNRDTAGCEGCPYLLPWGPTLFGTKSDGSKGYYMDIKGYECRMSPVIDYATTYYGSADDKTTLRIVSLDLDFLSEIQAWMDKHAGGQLFGGFSRQNIRSTDYSSGGRYSLSIACAQNKQGMAAKAELIQRFFRPDKSRRGKTPEQEKAIVLAAIEEGKAAAQRKESEMEHANDLRAEGLPEVCRGCQCATCGNEDCPTPCFRRDDEVEECEQFGPMADGCEDYQPKEDAQCLKKPAPNGDAAASTAANAAQELQLEETPITPTNASSSSAPASLADAGAATQSLCAADAASLAAEEASEFDYSGFDDQTVAGLHLAEREYAGGKKMAEMGLRRMADAVAIAHDALCVTIATKCRNGDGVFTNSETTFGRWCDSIGIHRKAAERLLQVSKLMDNSTPREQRVLEELSPTLLYAAAKPSAPAELVQSVKNGDITTHKQFKELESQLKAAQQAREKAEQQLADAQREHQAERESTSALLRNEQQRRQKAEEGRIAAEKDKADARRRAEEAEAQCTKDAALVDKLQGYLLQRDNEVAEQKERADAAEIRARQAENRPVEVAVQAPDPAEVQRLASEKAAEMTAMLKAQLHALQTQLDDAESRADAAENSAYMSAAEFADKSADIIDGIRATFWAMAKELPDADFNQALEPLDVAVSRIYNREWEDGWNDSWENNEEDDEQ